MGEDQNVQDQNLVDDQVEQAISESTAAVTDAANALNGSVAEPGVTGTGVTPPLNPVSVPEPITSKPSEDTTIDEDESDDTEEVTSEAPASVVSPAPTILSDVQAAAASLTDAKASNTGDDNELVQVKQQALEQLAPLVTKIDLPPQEKFDTLMSIIRAGDDKSLIKPAFDAAQLIADDDKKAQALLDVVNEVNYLTHPELDEDA